ncbi:MAG: hypothetical protein DRI34_06280 [Deltaproteobacteria bacterium]|nr:MAG: hypothetical protein DRI34_06280 [Deltaproteobacteria bacterium]
MKDSSALRWLGPAAVLLLAVACDGGRQRLDYLDWPIINGQPDKRVAHMGVVAVVNNIGMCSGTLIAPRVVLTAAHCVAGAEPRDFLVLFGPDTGAAITRRVSETAVHNTYNPQQDSSRGDIGLLLLSSGPPPGIAPIAPLPAELALGQQDVGRDIEFVGFGQDENGEAGTRLWAPATIDMVCEAPSGCSQGMFFAEAFTICQDQQPSGICFGDSGGPALVVENSTEYVAGVSSYVYENCQLWGCSTKVDVYEDFIQAFVAGRPGADCASGDDCRSGMCVGGICCEQECPGPCSSCAVPGSLGSCQMVPDDTPCPDGDRCNGDETCQNGQCLPGEPPLCQDDNPCTEDVCNAASGCIFRPVADGTSCDDGDLCNGEEICQQGSCVMQAPADCDDGNPCTEDSCEPGSGCQHRQLADGSACGEGLCGQMACRDGQCQVVNAVDCSDDNPCTRDTCDPETGCLHEPWPDGMKCGSCRVCQDVTCVEDPDCAGRGCGCTAGGDSAPASWLAGLLLVLLAFRRRSVQD